MLSSLHFEGYNPKNCKEIVESNFIPSAHLFPNIDRLPSGMHLPRSSCVRPKRLRTGVGRFRSSLHNWGIATIAADER